MMNQEINRNVISFDFPHQCMSKCAQIHLVKSSHASYLLNYKNKCKCGVIIKHHHYHHTFPLRFINKSIQFGAKDFVNKQNDES